jgi:hypothetical protein
MPHCLCRRIERGSMASAHIDPVARVKKMGERMTCGSHAWVVEMKERYKGSWMREY